MPEPLHEWAIEVAVRPKEVHNIVGLCDYLSVGVFVVIHGVLIVASVIVFHSAHVCVWLFVCLVAVLGRSKLIGAIMVKD